jgi:hypothetical protein
LIVCGFLGTFFSLERAVTLKRAPAYLAPLLTVAGSIIIIARPTSKIGPLLAVAGSLVFFLVCLALLRRQFTLYEFFILLGSIQWTLGNAIWFMQWPVYNVTLWWISFVLLATAGERLEIARMIHVGTGPWIILIAGLGAVFIGHIVVALGHLSAPDSVMDIVGDAIYDPRTRLGMRIAGVGMGVAAAWFIVKDPARAFLGRPGIAGYISFCMMAGYGWLAVAGFFSVRYAGLVSGETYDSAVHMFFLGFLMSMIMGHGPVLVPSILELFLDMRPSFYVAPVLLHASLLLRVAGDVRHSLQMRKWGGMLGALSIGYFMAALLVSLWRDNRAEVSDGEA